MLYILTHILILFVVDPQVKAEDDRAGDLGKHPSGEVCRQEKRGQESETCLGMGQHDKS